jgi:hypothetical protein
MELGIIHRGKQKVMTVGRPRLSLLAAMRRLPPVEPTSRQRRRRPRGSTRSQPPADALQGAITHDNQTEGYYIISGSGIAFIDGKLLNGRQSTNNPDGGPNGPGCGGGVAVAHAKSS